MQLFYQKNHLLFVMWGFMVTEHPFFTNIYICFLSRRKHEITGVCNVAVIYGPVQSMWNKILEGQPERSKRVCFETHSSEAGAGAIAVRSYFPGEGWLFPSIDCINTAIILGLWKQSCSPFCNTRHKWSRNSKHFCLFILKRIAAKHHT